MKYFLFTLLLLAGIAGKAQSFYTPPQSKQQQQREDDQWNQFVTQQPVIKILVLRVDSLTHELSVQKKLEQFNTTVFNAYITMCDARLDSLQHRIDSLSRPKCSVAGLGVRIDPDFLDRDTLPYDPPIYYWGRNKVKPDLPIPIDDTTYPGFNQIVFLMQQNKELSDRLDRLEEKIDTMHREINMLWEINRYNARYSTELDNSLMKRIDSLGRRPYLFYDPKGVRPGFYLTNSAGEYQIFVSPLK